MDFCPNCGEQDDWHFHYGECNADDGKLEPDQGECYTCGFFYSQHVFHPLKEQLERFRKSRKGGETVKATRIFYKKLVNLGDFEHEQVGIELEVEEGERAEDVLAAARRFVRARALSCREVQDRNEAEKILAAPAGKHTLDLIKWAKEILPKEAKEVLPF